MTTYKQLDENTIQFSTTNEDGSVTNGPIVNGRTRTRQVQTGTQEVASGSVQVENGSEQAETHTISVEVGIDEEGNPIFEDQMQYTTVPTYETVITYTTEPVFTSVAYSPWDELMATNPTIEPAVVEVIGYVELRKAAYPSITDFADAYVKVSEGDSTDMDAYVADCLAVKLLYPKD